MRLTDHTVRENLFRLDGRVALVTGASSGIGRRCARVLSTFGASVVLAARRQDRLQALAAELGSGLAVECDVSEPAEAAAIVDAAVGLFGKLDVVVNAAGVSGIVPAIDESPEDFARVVATNLEGPFATMRRAAEVMIGAGHGGSLINVGSIFGVVGVGQMPQAAYAASKGGLVNLTRELAAQWARRGVRVNAINPGWFRTEMTQGLFEDAAGMRWLRSKTPMGRAGELNEIDGALLLLAGDAGSFITGQTITVDGGWTSV